MRTAILLAVLFIAAGLACAAEAPARRPNVVIVLTDDQGYGDLGCHGNPVLKTPNLDRLHEQSIRLTDFHVAPMCTPTRGQLMTGRDALDNGAMNVSSGRTLLRRGIPTMAEIFRGSGYRTGQFGKWHLGDNYPYRPQDRGFERTLWFPSSHIPSAPDRWGNDYFDPWLREQDGRVGRFPGYCTDVIFEQAVRWIRERAGRKEPFLAYIATNAPHGPLWVPDHYRRPYADRPRNVASFFGMVANIDENIGTLDRALTELGLREDTLLIFMTDNGGTAGASVHNAGMRGRKIDLYEGGHRVPFFLRWPAGRLRLPGDIAELTECQDVLPTLIDLCGLRKRSGLVFDGTSLAPMLRGTSERLPDRMLVTQFSRMNDPVPRKGDACVLWGRWRLVQDRELYDLSTDPSQQVNLADRSRDVAAKMREHYARWWAEVEPRVNEASRIGIGSKLENPVMLSAADWDDVFLDQSAQVRRGERKNGPWNLQVERGGTYEISLRRWPAESGLAIRAPAPPFSGRDGGYPAGVALPVGRARLQVGAFDQTLPVGPDDGAVSFTVELRSGPARLQTWFLDEQGVEICGAYYVYVRRK
jgi:arylsulfatase A-like enzyme